MNPETYEKLIRLAHAKPDLRVKILPLLKEAAMRPDVEFPNEKGQYPEYLGRKILRGWKVQKGKCFLAETEKREFYLAISKDSLNGLPYGSYHWDRFSGRFFFGKRDMGLVKQFHPRWVQAWEKVAGEKSTDRLPVWYQRQMVLSGDVPFDDAYSVQEWLRENGWREDKKYDGFFKKKVGRGLVRLHVESYSTEIRMYAYPSASIWKSWGDSRSEEYKAKEQEFNEHTERTLPIQTSTGKDLEAKAVEVSKAVNTFRPKPKATVLTDVDKDNVRRFTEDAKQNILDYLEEDGRNPYTGKWNEGRTTRWLSDLIVFGNGGLEMYRSYFGFGSSLGKREVGRLFSKILKQMEKEGLVWYDLGGKYWYKK